MLCVISINPQTYCCLRDIDTRCVRVTKKGTVDFDRTLFVAKWSSER
jgi:hypothetical protein